LIALNTEPVPAAKTAISAMSTLPNAEKRVLEEYGVTNAQPAINWFETHDETRIKAGRKKGTTRVAGTTGLKNTEFSVLRCRALIDAGDEYL